MSFLVFWRRRERCCWCRARATHRVSKVPHTGVDWSACPVHAGRALVAGGAAHRIRPVYQERRRHAARPDQTRHTTVRG